MEVVDRIKSILLRKGMTQAALAETSGLTKETISRILNGKQELRPNTLEKIARALDVSVFHLQETEYDREDQYKINGYIEFGYGTIRKVTSLKQLKDVVAEIELKEQDFNFKEAVLPPQKKITLKDIDYLREEYIDATKVLVKSFKSGDDVIDGEKFDIGNMCSGYDFEIDGFKFHNSEAAYIAGLFSNNTLDHCGIQEELQNCNNGWDAKKKIRAKYEKKGRTDWTEPDPETGIPFNVEWMKYVVWRKCRTNQAFAAKLKAVPREAWIVEDSTGNHSSTAKFWGCHNNELRKRREMAGEKYKAQHPTAKAKTVRDEKLKMNNVGIWRGKNVMGKILKACSICLLEERDLPINTRYLFNKRVYLFGARLDFGEERGFYDFDNVSLVDEIL